VQNRAILFAALLVLLGLGLTSRPVSAQDIVTGVQVETQIAAPESTSPFFVQFGIAGKPTSLAIENTGRVWVTLPELDAIGVISVTAATSQTVTSYLVRTYYLAPGSQPYDLTFHAGEVWFTAYGGNSIGRLDPATDSTQTYPIPENDSGPTGIAVATDGKVWFAQRTANRLSQLDPISGTFQSYPYTRPDGGLEEVATVQPDSIWFTAPNVNRVANLDPVKGTFVSIPTLPYTMPMGLAVEPGDDPWVSVFGGNLVGRYAPGTLAFWRWTALPSGSATTFGPQRIALAGGGFPRNLFYANGPAQQIGRMLVGADSATGGIRQLSSPSSACTALDVAIDGDGNAWFTCGPANTVFVWRSPFSLDTFIPIVEIELVQE
jgi:streptogramin lyase